MSQATTSASRARAAERFQSPTATRDGRRPSEQWLGKPYDPQQERSKRKIPELGKINFEERRARIQKAISQNLEESRSQESLKARSLSRQGSLTASDRQAAAGAEAGEQSVLAQHHVEADKERESMPGGWPTPGELSVDTFQVPHQTVDELLSATTAGTEFEDESPILGRAITQDSKDQETEAEQPTLLTSATYQPPSGRMAPPTPISPVQEAPAQEVQSPTVLENVMQMRKRSPSQASRSGTDYADDDAPVSGEDSPSDLEDRWGLGNGLMSVEGSIKIMLDNEPRNTQQDGHSWLQQREEEDTDANYVAYAQHYDTQEFPPNGFTDSPVHDRDGFSEHHEEEQSTPRKDMARQDTIRASTFKPQAAFAANSEDVESQAAIARALRQYQSTGTITAEMLEQMQRHMVDLQRVSANEGSNGFMIQSLLDSVLNSQQSQDEDQEEPESQRQPSGSFDMYEIPPVTPDTPPGWNPSEEQGTAVVYSKDASYDTSPREDEKEGEEDFYVKIRKADEAWERQQRGEYLRLDGDENNDRPEPPPKDDGYTPRSSFGPSSATFPQDLAAGLRISTTDQRDVHDTQSGTDSAETKEMEQRQGASLTSPPPQPSHAPPPPPSASASVSGLPFGMAEVPQIPASYSERGSSELSPRARRNLWGPSGSSRPSVDSQRPGPPPVPGSVSMTSLGDSARQDSMDAGIDSQSRLMKEPSPSPEQKRLLKRRHIIRELLDTENTYHQDLKIIEDIYKATAVPDLISPEDKKILFGNCDEIERFSLHFYDDMRKAVAGVYVPAKQMRWMNKRGSYSTTQSDGTGQTPMMTSDGVDDEKDRTTTIGQAFLQNLQRMEHIYSMYLRNHEAANQRLSALRNTATVKCWLDECHNNANDITSAWDLDSLLVKPTQRVAKYPMLLQQLIETTPTDHPDREALGTAAKDSINMLTRINEAKKRADLVDQIVNRKRKDSDMRTGIAKAFGRRTEKLKERVGIAEAFQDPDYDELSHKFGGHFIRLQICMRDVQAYMHGIEKTIDQVTNYAGALELFTDVSMASGSELESKWRKYGQAIRELTSIAFTDHKATVNKRVISPMVACIKLHEGPQNAINDRKKRIVDYAKCKSIEKRGEKPDKKTVEASDMYIALNDQLKLELPKLYSLTANLVQGCLNCFLEIQLTWYNIWERKLRPLLEAADIPGSIQAIEPAFKADYNLVKDKFDVLGICNGALLAETANFLSPSTTLEDSGQPSSKRPSTLDSSKRTMSVGSDTSRYRALWRISGEAAAMSRALIRLQWHMMAAFVQTRPCQSEARLHRHQVSAISASRPWSNAANTPASSFSTSRPATANPPTSKQATHLPPRTSAENARSPRPMSGATYFTARPEQPEDHRFSNIFSSAMPSEAPDLTLGGPAKAPTEDLPVLFVCASLFEFSIDKTRKEGGYPYLTYVQGEVFDVIAQKGELWLAKNQDDSSNTLGWIWSSTLSYCRQD